MCIRDRLNPDSTDWDKDGNTTEKLCRANDPVQVRLAAAAETTKWDKGPLPNALQSSGEPVSYTHLDVYKRQPWQRRQRRWLGNLPL